MDAGQEETEKLLKRIQADVVDFYGEAKKDIEKKYNEFNKAFKLKDEVKRKQLKVGEITDEQYKDWLTGQLIAGERWQEQLDVLSAFQLSAYRTAHSLLTS